MFTAAATEAKPWVAERVALVQHVLGGVAHRKAVHVDDARGHALAALDAPGGKLQGVAVFKYVDVVRVDAGGLGQLRVARRCVASPWTGMKFFGFTMESMIFSSSAPA